ncbi:N-formylglutamate amidohydrolase [Acetobacter ghanensis]|uniref:N-formylglutamate amidohydrolase n=1 Tax=Acetobacter ghanensis TaxID=431306 RepID=A0A0U4YAK1_9PROT|nr:N-formylglutamate amidohydrolase [Acetobacter ghanensis]NHO39431.1 N-formylglutamate amidohydrolase [Acetobacter ghanensis]GBQ46544.1 N-formylglutamate amidohydrolase [Acetobacter ghanensis DSM 18895]CEF54565.1 N-formylglutamate deformylase [Acetobacter ghanensis]
MKNFASSLFPPSLKRFFQAQQEANREENPSRQAAPAPVMLSGTPGAGPVVLASPHSGHFYPEAFVQAARQPLDILRSGEDSFVDELAKGAQALGPPLIHATFPRVFCDVNRAAWDLDSRMFHGTIPSFVSPSERGLAGLGSIPRIVADRRPIYRQRLPFMEAALRIRHYWMPYHAALAGLLEAALKQYGFCLLLDLHSMPDALQAGSPDFVLGDRYGTSCSRHLTNVAEQTLQGLGFKTARNHPYAGGYITRHYGRPSTNMHALQIEMRRGLYMEESTRTPHEGFAALTDALTILVEQILAHVPTQKNTHHHAP